MSHSSIYVSPQNTNLRHFSLYGSYTRQVTKHYKYRLDEVKQTQQSERFKGNLK